MLPTKQQFAGELQSSQSHFHTYSPSEVTYLINLYLAAEPGKSSIPFVVPAIQLWIGRIKEFLIIFASAEGQI